MANEDCAVFGQGRSMSTPKSKKMLRHALIQVFKCPSSEFIAKIWYNLLNGRVKLISIKEQTARRAQRV